MKIKTVLLLSCLSLLLLTGCISREQADAKLARACEAGVKSLLAEGQTIDKVNGFEASKSSIGAGYRQVILDAVYMDGWLEENVDYQCIFEESWGLFRSGYTAAIYQIRLNDGRLVGKSGGDIIGSAQEFLQLTDAVSAALYK